MTWSQFRMWMAYYEIEPFGEERADLRAGIVASEIRNNNPNIDPRRFKPSRPSDFMPDFDKSKKKRRRAGRSLSNPEEWNRVMGEIKDVMLSSNE